MKNSNNSVKKVKQYVFSEELREILVKEQEDSVAVVYGIILCYKCNCECVYCYENGIERDESIITEAQIKDMFCLIKNISELKTVQKTVFFIEGGEPFMPELGQSLYKLLEALEEYKNRNNDTDIYFFSNGINTLEHLKLIKAYSNIITSFLITLIGDEELHNKYRKSAKISLNSHSSVLETIDTLLENNIKVKITLNLDDGNLIGINQVINLVKEKNWICNNNFLGIYPSIIKYLNENNKRQLTELDVLVYIEDKVKIEDISMFDFGNFKTTKRIINNLNTISNNANACAARKFNQFLFDHKGYIYTCTKATGRTKYAIGKYSPKILFYNEKINWWYNAELIETSYIKCMDCNVNSLCEGVCVYELNEKECKEIPCPEVLKVKDYIKSSKLLPLLLRNINDITKQ